MKTTLKVLSLNLWSKDRACAAIAGGESVDMRVAVRSPKVNALLLGEDIDIAGLQEASPPWQSWLFSDLYSHYACLGTCTVNTREGGYIIYRKEKLKPLESGTFWLAPGAPTVSEKGWDASYDRLCTWAFFLVQETQSHLLFLNAHLDHKGQTAKVEGAKLILEQIDALRQKIAAAFGVTNCPVVLTGDMNARPEEPTYAAFATQLGDSLLLADQTDVEPSHDSSPGLYFRASEDEFAQNGHRIDYIFFTEDSIRVKRYSMIHTATNLCQYGPYITDHNAIISILEF